MHKIRIQLPQDWLGHQHGGRFIVLGQRYDCPDSLFQNSQLSLTVLKQIEEIYGLDRRRLFVQYFVIKLDLIVMFFFRPGRTKCFLNVFSDTLSSKR